MSFILGSTPSVLPEWATDPAANVVEPSQGQKEDGWDANDKVPAAWLNWWQENVYDWLKRLQIAAVKNWMLFETNDLGNGSILGAAANADGLVVITNMLSGRSEYLSASLAVSTHITTIVEGDGFTCGVAFNGTYWCVVGHGTSGSGGPAILYTTADEDPSGTWSSQSLPTNTNSELRSVCWGNSTWVAVGGDNGGAAEANIVSSTDGTTWTQRTAGSSSTDKLRGVAHDATLEMFCAVGETGSIQTAGQADLATWTAQTADGSYTGEFNAVASNNLGTFVAVGASGELQYTTDGSTWNAVTLPDGYSADLHDIKYANGLFVAAGDTGGVITLFISEDGQNWEAVMLPPAASGGQNPVVVWTGRQWMVIDSNENMWLGFSL